MTDKLFLFLTGPLGLAEEDYTRPMASLPTKNGRATGNAITVGLVESLNPDPTYLVVTDAGNQLKLTVAEMQQLFHPPKFLMTEYLPAHQKSLLDS